MDGLEIDVKNFSKLQFYRNNWHIGAGSEEGINWTDELTATPSEQLAPHIGATSAAAHTEHLSIIVKDALYLILGYGNSEGDFAVKLQQLFHMFGQGPQTQWARYDKSWNSDTTDTNKYVWTFPSTVVEATPSLANDGGTVSVIIKDRV